MQIAKSAFFDFLWSKFGEQLNGNCDMQICFCFKISGKKEFKFAEVMTDSFPLTNTCGDASLLQQKESLEMYCNELL